MDAWLKREGKLKMASIENMIKWFKDREGKVTYSMNSRLGPNSYDCSSAVYFSLIAGGFLPSGTGIGNTDSLFALEGKLLTSITRSEVKRGDIFVAGYKGNSGGSDGHTGVFVDSTNIIHCTLGGGKNGIVTTPATNWMGDYSGLPVYFYRLKGANPPFKYKVDDVVYIKNNATHYFNGDLISDNDKKLAGKVTGVKYDDTGRNGEHNLVFVKQVQTPTIINHWTLERDLEKWSPTTTYISNGEIVKFKAAAQRTVEGTLLTSAQKSKSVKKVDTTDIAPVNVGTGTSYRKYKLEGISGWIYETDVQK